MFRVSLQALFLIGCALSGWALAGIHAGVGAF